MNQVYINHIAAFLPNKAVQNKDMEKVIGQVGNKPSRMRKIILASNKIKERYYAIDPASGKTSHSNAQLTAEAIAKLAEQGCPVRETELLSCGTSIPDQLIPNHAVMVQAESQIPPCETISTAGVCLSGIAALKYCYLSIASSNSNNGIATGSENASATIRSTSFVTESKHDEHDLKRRPELAFNKDFLRWMLSDGAGAMWLSKQANSNRLSLRIDWIIQKSYANELETCMYAGGERSEDGTITGWREFSPDKRNKKNIFNIQQDVKLLNEKIIEYTVTRPMSSLIKNNKVTARQIDWFLPHYSSGFFRDKVHEGLLKAGCDIPQEKWFTNLYQKGNTGSASIYIILEELFNSAMLKKGEKILCYIPESGRFSTAFMSLTVV